MKPIQITTKISRFHSNYEQKGKIKKGSSFRNHTNE